MVSKDLIIKSIEYAIKCASSTARSIGASVVKEKYVNEKGEEITQYTYKDGTKLEMKQGIVSYHEEGEIYYDGELLSYSNITYNDKQYPILSNDTIGDGGADKFFQHQKEEILSRYGQEGWDFFCKYSNEFGTYQGWNLNKLLRGIKTEKDITDEMGDFHISPFLLENHARFVEMEKHLSLDKEDFVSVRLMGDLHRNDGISKKIVSDKAHTSSSIVGEVAHYETYGDYNNGWFVFTLNDKGSGVKGGYLGSAIQEADGYDFEREVNYVPNQKFERLIIDEENKFIIQKPIIE